MPRPLRVFLCHASQDKPAVRKLHRYLKQHGIEPWLDEIDLLPGENWEVEIPRALNGSDVILVCLSKNSANKEGYVQKEISFALDKALEKPEGTIFIIPAKLEECDVPKSLNRFQWVDLFRPDSNKRLLMGLNKRAADLGVEVSPVILEDMRQRKITPKPTVSDFVDVVNTARIARESIEFESEEIDRLKIKEREKMQQKEPVGNGGGKIRLLAVGSIIFALFSIIFGGNYLVKNMSSTTQTPFATASVTLQPLTPTWTKTQTNTLVPPASTLGIGSTITGEKGDILVYVPAGEFTMGSDNGAVDEKPVHTVYLDAFWIDQTEVTNKQYKACVDAGICEPPSNTSSLTHPSYYGNPEFDNYPVFFVTWDKANRYCEVWTGGDLPTEAQWEKAARGTDARTYPWGNGAPDNNLLNYNGNVDDTTEVGAYPSGVSFYGAYDMAGNVWEWVNDWYDKTYYGDSSASNNPVGPESGQYRTLRGGSWDYVVNFVRSAYRFSNYPSATFNNIGFRCSRSP